MAAAAATGSRGGAIAENKLHLAGAMDGSIRPDDMTGLHRTGSQ